ncbi:hypothetical protein JZO73_10755 [Enterococcus plantarum]|uniref:hypothetical protein n=1 Tax=Enterococcus plantarum TaxID=1077675 RepID=UPI001A8E49ED|nr:hypothetical protein [Enterococcus plantarum]MBO0468008.1 hypothetical protein [Enterococcus plantarum]
MWSNEKIEKQREYFKEQRTTKMGKFTEFTVRTYYCIYKSCALNNKQYCLGSDASSYKINKIIYEGFYGGVPDHDNKNVIDDCKKKLKEMGYIKFKKENNVWLIYVIKNLDFLLPGEHEFYIEKFGIEHEIQFF